MDSAGAPVVDGVSVLDTPLDACWRKARSSHAYSTKRASAEDVQNQQHESPQEEAHTTKKIRVSLEYTGRRDPRFPTCQEMQVGKKTPSLPQSVPQLKNPNNVETPVSVAVVSVTPKLGAEPTLAKSQPVPALDSSPVPTTPKASDTDEFEVDYGPTDPGHDARASRTPPAPPPPPCRHQVVATN